MNKQKKRREPPLPPPCVKCRSLHKKYDTLLCNARRLDYHMTELKKSLPLIGRFFPAWECDLAGEEAEP